MKIDRHVYAAGPRDYPIEYSYEPPGWVPKARDGILAEPIYVASDGTVAVYDAPGLVLFHATDLDFCFARSPRPRGRLGEINTG
jgi:hypothetical protein